VLASFAIGTSAGDHLSRGRILPPALTLGTPRDSDPREQDAAEYGGEAGGGDKFASDERSSRVPPINSVMLIRLNVAKVPYLFYFR
jgi:hypothetical protein